MESVTAGSETGILSQFRWTVYPLRVLLYRWLNCLQMYLDAAEQEREKYMQEMAVYKQSEAYRQFNEKQKKKQKTEPIDEVMEN